MGKKDTMIVALFVFAALCLYETEALKSEFSTKEEAEKYVADFLVYEDHLKGGNVNEGFDFIKMYISKDFVHCFGGECVEGRAEWIKSLNAVNGVVKDWSLTADVRNYGKKYLSLYTIRTITFLNDETFTLPQEVTIVLNDEGMIKYWISNPNDQKYVDEYNKILERNAGVQIKEDL